MANFALIVSEFSDFSGLDFGFSIRFQNTARSIDTTLTWTCKSLRVSAYQYTQGVNGSDQGAKALSAVAADIANDGTLSAYLNVSTASNAFQIEANEYGWTIEDDGSATQSNITLTETPEVLPVKDFQLTGFSIAAGIVPCSDVELTIAENDGVGPYTWITPSNVSTSLIAQIARQATEQNITVTLADSEADQASLANVIIPKIFNASDISSISVVTNTGGFDATVTVFMLSTFDYSYSLDGSTFQTSNVFPNVVDGDYTLYVSDGLGCVTNQAFTVDTATSIERASAYALVSKANPFRWVQFGSNKYQTLDNTLYKDEFYLGQHKPPWAQQYQTNDGVITNQFRSNYDSLSARILDCDGNIVDTLTIDKKSDNIGNEDKRDAIAFNRGDNQTGIYFTSGNIYDPGTTDIIDSYELNGQLPDWGVVGNTVILSGAIVGSYVIKQVIFDSSVQANALIIDYTWMSGNTSESVITECTYNRQDYEIYEFDFDTADYVGNEGVYSAQLLMTDSLGEYPSLIYNTDYLHILASHLRTNFVEYYDSEISGIDYSTGFVGRIRVKSLDPYAQLSPGGELDQYNDSRENKTTLKASATMEGIFYIQAIPKGYVEKFNFIFKHINLYINGEKWTMTEFETVIPEIKYSLKDLNVTVTRNQYAEYQTDNIDVDSDKGTIDTQLDQPILQ